MINFDQLKKYGLSKEELQRRGELDNMLNGRKTSTLIPLSLTLPGVAVVRTDARLSFQSSPDGIVLAVHGVRREPELEKPFFGHVFSEEDKKNLRESGNMGRVVDLRYSNENVPSLISIDKLTNEIVSMRADNLRVDDELFGVKLTEQEKADLKEGKKIFVEGMKSPKNNKEFSAEVQISAERRGIEFIFPKDANISIIGGVQLSPKQQEDLNSGKAIFVEGIKSKDDKTGNSTYDRFVKKDETGRTQYYKYNPDSPETAREIVIPKVLNGVELTGQDRADLREGKAVWVENMTARNGDEYSAFVRFDTNTGDYRTAKTMEGLDEARQTRIPEAVYGKQLTATERAQLQDGKAVHLTGLTGHDQKPFDAYAKVNARMGHIEYFQNDPDQKRDTSQGQNATSGQNQNSQEQRQGQKNTQQYNNTPPNQTQRPDQKPAGAKMKM